MECCSNVPAKSRKPTILDVNPAVRHDSYKWELRVAHMDHLPDCWKFHIFGVVVEGSGSVSVHHIVIIVAASHVVKQIRVRPNVTVQHLVPHIERADLKPRSPSSVPHFERADLQLLKEGRRTMSPFSIASMARSQ
jgi:hypothetical protein